MTKAKLWWFVVEGQQVYLYNKDGRMKVPGDRTKSSFPAIAEIREANEDEKEKIKNRNYTSPLKVRISSVFVIQSHLLLKFLQDIHELNELVSKIAKYQ